MLRKFFVTLGLLICFGFGVHSQTKSYAIKARIVNEKDTLLAGNFLVLSEADSLLIKGTYFLEEEAHIKGDFPSSVLVKIKVDGYRDSILRVDNSSGSKEVNMNAIRLRPVSQDFDNVVVVFEVPLFEAKKDGSVEVNVQKTMLTSCGSLIEVLAKSPGVIVGSSNVTVVGKGEAFLYKDGKQITFEQLKTIQVNQVKKLQIIANPSARYDAEGRAVINVVSVPNYAEGLEGVFTQNFTLAQYFLWGGDLGLNYRKKKWSISASYGVLLGEDWMDNDINRSIGTDIGAFNANSLIEENTRYTYSSNYKFGVGYKIDSISSVSVEYSGLFGIFDLNNIGRNTMVSPSGVTNLFQTQNTGSSQNIIHSLSLNYQRTLDSLGSSLRVGGQYSKFESDLDDLIDEKIYTDEELTTSAVRNNVGNNDIEIANGKLDYTRVFKNGSSLDVGAKYSHVNNRGGVKFFSKDEGSDVFVNDPSFNNEFEYNEQISALYAVYNGSLSKKVNFSLGLRGEYTDAIGISRILNQTVLDTTYLNLFPSGNVSMSINDRWSSSLAYSSRITRAKYQDLDPFVWYQDTLTSFQGNPFLIPELIQSLEASLTLDNKYTLKLGVNDIKNPMKLLPLRGPLAPNSIVLKTINVQQQRGAYASLTIPFEYKSWSSYNLGVVTLNSLSDTRSIFTFTEAKPELYLYSYNEIGISNWFKLEIFGEFIGGSSDRIYTTKATGMLSAGVSKSFLKNALQIRFMANDIFSSYRAIASYSFNDTEVDYNIVFNTNFYRLSVIFNFGKLKEIVYNNNKTGSEELDRIKQ